MALTLKEGLDPDDVQAVAQAIWDRGQREIRAFGYDQPLDLAAMLIVSGPEYAFTLESDGRALAVFGACRQDSGAYRSYFLATDAFIPSAKEATRLLRAFLKRETAKRPNARLECLSASDHPDSERWFKLLGFYSAEPLNGIARYIYGLTGTARPAIFPVAPAGQGPLGTLDEGTGGPAQGFATS